MSVATLKAMGAHDVVLEDFATLASATNIDGSCRFHKLRVMAPLARFIAGQGGRQRELPLYELCYLIGAVNMLLSAQQSGDVSNGRQMFFLGQETLSAASLSFWFRQHQSPGTDVQLVDNGICITLADAEEFRIAYRRMPLLVAVYEYLLSMRSFAHFEEFTKLFDRLNADGMESAEFRDVINQITSSFRRYRRDMVDWSRYEDKFNAIFSFLAATTDNLVCDITDETIVNFWRSHFHRKDFKLYRTVFNCFADFIRIVESAANRVAESDSGHTPGAHRRELRDDHAANWPEADWQTPLAILDEAPVDRIRYLTASRERRRLEPLLRQGPIALRLPRAFLRGEAFGPVQDRIRNDLQQNRGSAAITARLNCGDAVPYQVISEELDELRGHCDMLLQAGYYVLTNGATDAVACVPETPMAEAQLREIKTAFLSINRQGFRTKDLQDPEIVEAHARGAEAILATVAFLDRFQAVTAARKLAGEQGQQIFAQDLPVFRDALNVLYGADT